MKLICLFFSLPILAGPLATPLEAEVVNVGANGFSIRHTFQVHRAPRYVYNTIVKGVGAWWDSDHTWSGQANRLSIQPRAGGCFCERLPGGGSVEHLRVVFAQPGRRLSMRGGLGPLQELAITGAFNIKLEEMAGSGTRVELTYNVVGYQPSGFDSLSKAVDGVLGGQMKRLEKYLNTGRPE